MDAPLEDVWKLLYDPHPVPRVVVRHGGRAEPATARTEDFTYWVSGYPDFPMPQRLRADHADRRVTISCLVSFLEFSWQLDELAGTAPGSRSR